MRSLTIITFLLLSSASFAQFAVTNTSPQNIFKNTSVGKSLGAPVKLMEEKTIQLSFESVVKELRKVNEDLIKENEELKTKLALVMAHYTLQESKATAQSKKPIQNDVIISNTVFDY